MCCPRSGGDANPGSERAVDHAPAPFANRFLLIKLLQESVLRRGTAPTRISTAVEELRHRISVSMVNHSPALPNFERFESQQLALPVGKSDKVG